MRHNQPDEYIGVDVGAVRVGVARGSDAARMAEPLTTLPADGAIKKLGELSGAYQAAGIVVGLPRGLDGKETAQTNFVKDWVERAQKTISLPFYWQDEALTTKMSQNQDLKADIDAAAAAMILQDFLDSAGDDRVAV